MDDLNTLAKNLFDAKRAEDAAKKQRIAAEEAIAVLVETGDNGSKTVDAGEGLKVVVKRALRYKADLDAIRALSIPDILMPVDMTPPVPAGYAFNEKKYEELREQHMDTFNAIAKFVTATPAKVSVTLKLA
jgi:hypothetical protein